MTVPSAIDLTVLAALIAQLGDSGEAMRRTLLDTYLLEGDQRMAELRMAVDREDCTTIRSVAHTMKSSSALLGVVRLSVLMQQIEDAARAKTRDVPALAVLVEAEYARAAQEIRAQLVGDSTATSQAGTR